MKSLDTGCFGTPRKLSIESEPLTCSKQDSLLEDAGSGRHRIETEIQNRFSEFVLPSEDVESNKDEVVRLDALNVINMEAEVKVSQTISVSLGLLGGAILFCANMLMFIAAQIATVNHQNMAVVSAIANGTIPLGLLGSYFIYKEQLTVL